jgi:hypothetical protein
LNRAQIENDNPHIATVSCSSTKRDALRLATIYRDAHKTLGMFAPLFISHAGMLTTVFCDARLAQSLAVC